MNTTIRIVAAAVAMVALRRSCLVVAGAYRVGREVERCRQRRHGRTTVRQPRSTRGHGGLERARPGG